jgi:cytoplasmic iron level regulating protein YaaA (DUF328/UPF0246 family)
VRSLDVGSFDAVLSGARKDVRAALRDALRTSTIQRLERVLNARGPNLERALKATSAILRGRADVMPAWQRYVGVVWGHLEPSTLAADLLDHVLVPSGVYGITTANDLIGDYRLKMNVSLNPLGLVSAYWRPRITPVLSRRLDGQVVVSLLPKEHEAAIDLEALSARCDVITVGFRDRGGARAVGHDAKAVKGVLARRILDDGVEALEGFEWEGWSSTRHDQSVLVLWGL